MKKSPWIVIAIIFFLFGCATVDPTAGKKFDVESKRQCSNICRQVDMQFDALVVVGGMAGCVCGNRSPKQVDAAGGIIGGQVSVIAAAQAAQAAAAAQAAQRSQSQQTRQRY